jgi:mRNA interferase RelE/StbE
MYQVELLPEAINDLQRLDKPVAQRILNKLRWLAENFESVRPETLVGPLAELAKLRVGDYRVIYEPDRENRLITVHLLGHRREIYRQS